MTSQGTQEVQQIRVELSVHERQEMEHVPASQDIIVLNLVQHINGAGQKLWQHEGMAGALH